MYTGWIIFKYVKFIEKLSKYFDEKLHYLHLQDANMCLGYCETKLFKDRN